jgi:probable DNA metabolism protein
MTVFHYDGSFDGLLSAIFEAFRQRGEAADFVAGEPAPSLFAAPLAVATNSGHARRVERGIASRAGEDAVERLYRAFLSEEEGVERVIYAYIQAVVKHGGRAAENLLLEPVTEVARLAKRTGREVHRMHAFVRFEEQEDGSFAATVEPDCDVLPLIGEHFRRRFPTMRWRIDDLRRGYALVHEGGELHLAPLARQPGAGAVHEERFQDLWRTYFSAVNIPERANPRLHLQHLPRRYWRHLTEKR